MTAIVKVIYEVPIDEYDDEDSIVDKALQHEGYMVEGNVVRYYRGEDDDFTANN